jgi:hypothetical protein
MEVPRRIAAVSVNHNTSLYMELMLRSLFATHPAVDALGLSLTVLDNASEDNTAALRAYAARMGVPVLPSGFKTHTKHNSHGEVLGRFVLDHPDCTHYLFLDADVVFVQDGTVQTMADELDAAADAFGIGARMAHPWDPTQTDVTDRFRVYERRLHPGCALVRNTPPFRAVVAELGLACATLLGADGERYLDTGELLTMVMRTRGLRHIRSSRTVLHFFAVSYSAYGQGYLQGRAAHRDERLRALRERDEGDGQVGSETSASSSQGTGRP